MTLFLQKGIKMDIVVKDRIIHLRRMLLVHSCIYYGLDKNLISDDKWQELADELTRLQTDNPNLVIEFYDNEFKDWNGSTGFHLPRNEWILDKAQQLVRSLEK